MLPPLVSDNLPVSGAAYSESNDYIKKTAFGVAATAIGGIGGVIIYGGYMVIIPNYVMRYYQDPTIFRNDNTYVVPYSYSSY